MIAFASSRRLPRSVRGCALIGACALLGACASNTCTVGDGRYTETQEYPLLTGAGGVEAPARTREYAIPEVEPTAEQPQPANPQRKDKSRRSKCLDFPRNDSLTAADAGKAG